MIRANTARRQVTYLVESEELLLDLEPFGVRLMAFAPDEFQHDDEEHERPV